jgi:hypothetical protein
MLEAGRPGAVPDAAPAVQGQDSEPRSAGRLVLAAATAGLIVVFLVLWVLYLHVSRNQRVEADGASNALQAWDMLHGNLLLRGWTLEDVSFYTTELPEYMLVEALRGLNADVLHVSAALTYALMVPLAALLAKGRAPLTRDWVTSREAVVRMAIAGGILLAPQPGAGVFIVLFQPDHFGTQVPMLVTWLVLDRAPRRWFTPVAIGILLAWIGIGDPIVVFTGVVPLVLVAAVRALRCLIRRGEPWRPGELWRRRERLREAWFELSLAAAALIALLVSTVVPKLIHAAGGYTVLPVGTQLTTVSALPAHVRLAADGVLGLFGASFQGSPHGLALVFAILHLAGVALAVWALCAAIRHFWAGDDLIAQVLTVGIVLNIAAYLLSSRPDGYWSTREIAGILSAGAVLAGRLLGPRLVGTGRLAWRRAPGRLLASALAVVLAGYLAALGWAATRPAVPGVGQDVAGWLKARGLDYGLAYYGLAAPITMASGNSVHVLTVVTEPTRMAPGPHEFNVNWYDPRTYDANYVVLLAKPGSLDPMTAAQATTAFGPPAHEYRYREYLVLTWNKNLLAELGPAQRYVGITPG